MNAHFYLNDGVLVAITDLTLNYAPDYPRVTCRCGKPAVVIACRMLIASETFYSCGNTACL